MLVSILICSRNRCESLKETLVALRRLEIPSGIKVEAVLVDNGSTDGAGELMRGFLWPGASVVFAEEARPGKGHSLNTAIAASKGDILFTTDDDVRPPANWIDAMTAPIRDGSAHAVAGGVRMAPDLERDWFEKVHRLWLAESPQGPEWDPREMIGANMAFSRDILKRIPGFDPELGPGQLGYGEDTLFSYQIEIAGMKIADRRDIVVEHHFGADRISRARFEGAARNHGRVSAYIAHHWDHRTYRLPKLQALRKKLMLAALHRDKSGDAVTARELHDIRSYHLYSHYAAICNQPRNYEWRGLVKQGGVL